MATVIEVLNKKGEVVSFHSCDEKMIRIGRSYQNTVVLQDPFVDEYHLEITQVDKGLFRVVDQGSVNGTLFQRTRNIKSSSSVLELRSGDELTIGRTRLRLIDSAQSLAPAKKLKPQRRLEKFTQHPLAVISLLLATLAFFVFDQYLSAITETTLSGYLVELFQLGAVVLFVVVVFSLISKAVRHHWHFIPNLVHICLFTLVIEGVTIALNVLFFNYGYWPKQWLFDAVGLFVVVSIFAWIFTFNLFVDKPVTRWISVLSFASLVFAYNVTQTIASDKEYSKVRPSITDRFSSIVLPNREVMTDHEFVVRSSKAFEYIQQEPE
jgi:pSer/pThr/pTyr-binding forkhead associated (FHA) protein